MIINYQLNFTSINTSLQVGDLVYYIPTTTSGGFTVGSGNIILYGIVTSFGPTHVVVAVDSVNGPAAPNITDYIMFGKDSRTNIGSVLGYFAKTTFKNNSSEYAELFSIGSEISENSK